jgi:uncharacterized protein YgiM (DUF1202 family)
MKRLLLVVMLLLSATSCSFVENILDKFDIEIGKPKTERRRVTRTPRVVNRVYSYAYEGHLNIRETPSFNARIIGKFRNGPEGGNLLQDLGGWSQVEVNGVVGYVVSRYLKRTPTIPYTGRVGPSWIEGLWATDDAPGWTLHIYNNGYWHSSYYHISNSGYYVMQNNEVKFVTVAKLDVEGKTTWTGAKGLPNEEGWILKINKQGDKLGEYRRLPYEEPIYGDSDWPTKEVHRSIGQEVAKEVSAYMSK